MALLIIEDAYMQYEVTVNALVAVTMAENYEMTDRERETIKFHKRALSTIGEKLKAVKDTTEYMAWCMTDDGAFRLAILGEHFTHPVCLQRPRTEFEKCALECFCKMEYLITRKALELYNNL